VQVHQRRRAFRDLGFDLVAVGFSPPDALIELARHLGWDEPFCSDEPRQLYDRLDLGRARLTRVFNVGTLASYGSSLRRGDRVTRPVEDIRQLGGDVFVVDGRATLLARPASPDDRPTVDELLAAAEALAAR
jgi:hypothetical protein